MSDSSRRNDLRRYLGPALIAVAQPEMDCGFVVVRTMRLVPFVNEGTSFTGVTVTLTNGYASASDATIPLTIDDGVVRRALATEPLNGRWLTGFRRVLRPVKASGPE